MLQFAEITALLTIQWLSSQSLQIRTQLQPSTNLCVPVDTTQRHSNAALALTIKVSFRATVVEAS